MDKKTPYTIAIDFDGTLCEEAWPEIGSPRMDVIKSAIEHKKLGQKLILWTCREGEMLEKALAWCKGCGLEFDAVNANLPERIEAYGSDCRKIGADEYWDDKAVDYKSAVNSSFIWNAYKKSLHVISELLKERIDTCDFCENHQKCQGRNCKFFEEGEEVECNGKIQHYHWTCMDTSWGDCPKLETTPCYGCIENNNRGFELDYEKVVRYLEEKK